MCNGKYRLPTHSLFLCWRRDRRTTSRKFLKIEIHDVIKHELGQRHATKATKSSFKNTKITITEPLIEPLFSGSISPLETINIQEKHIDLKSGFLFTAHPKEKRSKLVPLIDEDIEVISSMPKGFPDLYYFRHNSGISGCRPGQKFGKRNFYKWWMKACENLGVEGIDLYGGTRHSSVIALTEFATPEQIKAGTMHTTNKAFERYYRVDKSDLKSLYSLTNTNGQNDQQKKGKHG